MIIFIQEVFNIFWLFFWMTDSKTWNYLIKEYEYFKALFSYFNSAFEKDLTNFHSSSTSMFNLSQARLVPKEYPILLHEANWGMKMWFYDSYLTRMPIPHSNYSSQFAVQVAMDMHYRAASSTKGICAVLPSQCPFLPSPLVSML